MKNSSNKSAFLFKKVYSPVGLSYLFLFGMLLTSIAIVGLSSMRCRQMIDLWVNGKFKRPVSKLADVKSISAGDDFNLAVTSDGAILGWGSNDCGQAVPPAGLGFAAVSAGGGNGVALTKGGSIVSWGKHTVNGLKTPPEGHGFIAVDTGQHWSAAVKEDGSIVTWGYGSPAPPEGNDFAAISVAEEYGLALTSGGRVVSWGACEWGPASSDANGYAAISAGKHHCLALKSDGTLAAWGADSDSRMSPPSGHDFVAVAAGGRHGIALKSDGSIMGWGDNSNGQATPPERNDFVAVSAGRAHSLALKSDGTVTGWGSNEVGQTGSFSPLKVLIDKTKFDFWASMATSIYCQFFEIPNLIIGQLGLDLGVFNWYPAYLTAGLTGFLFGRYLHGPARYAYVVILACIVYDNPTWHTWTYEALFVRCNIILVVFCMSGFWLRFMKTKKSSLWYGCIELALILLMLTIGNRLCTPYDL